MDIRHTITRFGATALIGCGLAVTAIPATFAQNGEESVTHVYSDKAASHISEVWYKGETLKITGEGFLTQDGTSGSTIAIKLNKGTVKIDGKDYLEVQADEKGNFSVSIPWQDDLRRAFNSEGCGDGSSNEATADECGGADACNIVSNVHAPHSNERSLGYRPPRRQFIMT